MNYYTTETGLDGVEFYDFYRYPCSIQESSLATEEAIWLGRDGHRMHLTRSHVALLLPMLQHFAETGNLPDPPAETPA